jgi:hypothetical protein
VQHTGITLSARASLAKRNEMNLVRDISEVEELEFYLLFSSMQILR